MAGDRDMAGRGRKPAARLVKLLNDIAVAEGSYNKAADRAGISRASYARAAKGWGGFADASSDKLAATYGEAWEFTARDAKEWSAMGDPPAAPAAPSPPEDAILTSALRFQLRDAKTKLTPEDYDMVVSILEQQVGMLAEAQRRGQLRLPKRQINYDGGDEMSRDPGT